MDKLRKHFSGSGLRAELSRGALGGLILKISSVLLSLAVGIFLARLLGPAGYGIYTYVFALVSIMAIPAQLGLPSLVVRETAKAHAARQWALMRGLWKWAALAVGAISLVLALVGVIIASIAYELFTSVHLATFAFGLALVPVMALGSLRDAALRGLRHIVMGQLSEFILRPGMLLLFLAISLFFLDTQITPSHAMALHALAGLIAFIIGTLLLWRIRPPELAAEKQSEYASRAWISAAWPLALISGMQLVNQNVDILMLGLFRSAEAVGIYKVATSGASLVTLGLQAITMAIAPHFARLHAQGDKVRLQRLVTLSARAILLSAVPVALALVLFGNVVLAYVFGKAYVAGRLPLAILALGQLVNAMMGSVGMLLIMTGFERDTARGIGIAAVANVILNLLLIPDYGITGAALAGAMALAIWNLVLWRAVHKRLGIESMAFRLFPSSTSK